MTIAAANLTANFGNGVTSLTTASISPTANALVIVSVGNNIASANTPTVSGASGTWVQIATVVSADGSRRVTMFRDLSSSPGSGALTIDFAAQSQTNVGYSIDQFTGVATSGTHGSGAIVQNQNTLLVSTNTGITVTLNALKSSNNAAYGYVRNNNGSNTIVAGSGFTQLSNQDITYEGEWALNKTAVAWTWASSTNNTQALAIEIQDNAPSFLGCPDPILPDIWW